MKSFTVSNFRSFREPATIELRPITVLLGRNSAGKSTLTRLIPLLKESVQRTTASPVLWANESVDFGSVSEVKNRGSKQDDIRISFSIDGSGLFSESRNFSRLSPLVEKYPPEEIVYTAFLRDVGGVTFHHSTMIQLDGQSIKIYWGNHQDIVKITLDGRPIGDAQSIGNLTGDNRNLFPAMNVFVEESELRERRRAPDFYPPVRRHFVSLLHGGTNPTKADLIFSRLSYVHPTRLKGVLAALPNVISNRLTNAAVRQIADGLIINELGSFIRYAERKIVPSLQASSYVGPVRATGDRFYRMQELAVSDIDASGANLAMYLRSLSPFDLAKFNDWLEVSFGAKVKVEPSGPSHISILISTSKSGEFENLSDVGFGYTQLLPVAAQLYSAVSGQSSRTSSLLWRMMNSEKIVSIEQPELHLHPALQSRLADLFAMAISENTGEKRFIIETHSEALIGRLGTLVATGQVRREDVGIYFIEKDPDTSTSVVKAGDFNDDGIIERWPAGFFSPS